MLLLHEAAAGVSQGVPHLRGGVSAGVPLQHLVVWSQLVSIITSTMTIIVIVIMSHILEDEDIVIDDIVIDVRMLSLLLLLL